MIQGLRSPYQPLIRRPVLVVVAESRRSQISLTKFAQVDEEIGDSRFLEKRPRTALGVHLVATDANRGSTSGEQKSERGVRHVMGVSYSYDNAGNLLSSGNGTATTTYQWNYRNRLTDTNDGRGASATTTSYKYDANDQRVQMDTKRGSSATTTTKYFNQYYETSTQGSNSTTTLNIYLPDGTLLATVEGNGAATTTSVIHTDHLGGTNVVSNETGSTRELVNYYPYGSARMDEKSGTTEVEKKYAGTEFDSATNLSYMQARMQSGTEGRFISQDPVARDVGMMQKMPAYILALNQTNGEVDQTTLLANPQLLNFYSYAANNPVTLSDPSGKFAFVPLAFALINAVGITAAGIELNTVLTYPTQFSPEEINKAGINFAWSAVSAALPKLPGILTPEEKFLFEVSTHALEIMGGTQTMQGDSDESNSNRKSIPLPTFVAPTPESINDSVNNFVNGLLLPPSPPQGGANGADNTTKSAAPNQKTDNKNTSSQ